MTSDRPPMTVDDLEPFSRRLFAEPASLGAVGTGFIGGKATGLVQGQRILAECVPDGDLSILHGIPAIGTKFKKPDQLGPQSQLNPAPGPVTGRVTFRLLPVRE